MMKILGFNRLRLLLRAAILFATCCIFLLIQNLANRYHSSVYQLTPYAELTATYEATIASVSIQENILLVDFQNCFEEERTEAQDEEVQNAETRRDRQLNRNRTVTTVDLAGCLNRLLLEASRLAEEASAASQQLPESTTKSSATSTSTVANLNTANSSSSKPFHPLKDLYLLQSWLNASFALRGESGGGRGKIRAAIAGAGASRRRIQESKTAAAANFSPNSQPAADDYASLLEHFNLSSLAPTFDPVGRLSDKYLYLSLRHVQQLDTILRHNFSADGVVNPVDASIDRRRGRRGLHNVNKSTASRTAPSHPSSSSSTKFSSSPPLTNLKLSEFADITRLIHGAVSCDSQTYGAGLTALVLVITKPDDYDIRATIRATWGSQFSAPNSTIRLLFAFGREPALANDSAPLPNDEQIALGELRVAQEAARYGDIVQWAFADGYYRLTIKSVAILRWASVYCPRVPALFKVDADCLLNYDALKRFSEAVARNQTATGGYYIYGNLWRRAAVLRSAKSKFYTSFLDYPQPIYPDYVGGPWYLAGPQLPLFMLRVAVLHSMPALLWEDLYVTGIVAEKLIRGGSRFPLTRHYMDGFDYNIDPDKFDYCAFNRSVILTQAFTQANLPQLWARVTQRTILRRRNQVITSSASPLPDCSIDW